MPEYLEYIKEREDLINTVPDDFVKQLEKTQNALFDESLIVIKGMDVKGANLQASAMNLKMVEQMRTDIRGWLRKNGYYESINELGKNYTKLIATSKKYYKALDLDPSFLERDLETLAQIRKNDLNFLMQRDKDVVNAVYDEVLSSVYSNSDWRQLAERLKTLQTDTILKNGNKLNGLLKKYCKTYATTAYAGFDRRIQTIKARQYNLDKFLFSGSLITDSREFCATRAGKVFSKAEINAWNFQSWNGKAKGRDVWKFLGGFNCRHILSPVTDAIAKEINAFNS